MAEPDDAATQARNRALSSPLRMRILRFCLYEARSNREIAREFDLNPGTSLHHVRTLVDTGFLAAAESRTGARGATEIPYLATRRSWRTPVPNISSVLIQTFLQEIEGVDPEDIRIARLGLMLDEAGVTELRARLDAVLDDFIERGPDADGVPVSVMIAMHPENRKSTT